MTEVVKKTNSTKGSSSGSSGSGLNHTNEGLQIYPSFRCFFNLDFGQDYINYALWYYQNGDLGNAALAYTDAGIEAGFNLTAAYIGAKGIGYIVDGVGLLTATNPNSLQNAINNNIASNPSRDQLVNFFKGNLRIEKGVESISRSTQKNLGVTIPGAIEKPWHVVINGYEIPVNPFNKLWELYK